ncbi:PadR family transcriptional regulator [Thermococcus sp. M39]|uniref:PadR family transcriptional regulator n=1 Tax=unclassified Thermococcus TaxID=2627626 RepID=UPI00143C5CDE|nr:MULTISPECIES: PadR family transcriptional regulator [unclassified Thermococcus]NJE08269.1 PadR family transcriptional regulator [Thermococcus sp. M39]NJE11762.1 PadR family transcriptional regulator [Thermococcus sp. LS2]
MFGDPKEKALKKLRRELRAGTYSFIILSILENKGDMHGYAIRKEFEKLSNGKIVPSEGTLYDLLKSLEKYKLIEGFWAEVGGRARKYYRITPLGKDVLKELKEEVEFVNNVVKKLMRDEYGWD